jgi:hypothetical protein
MLRADTDAATDTATEVPLETVPCVRYGLPDSPRQAPKVRSIFDSVPADAETASPIYLLTRTEFERQERFETGYELKGGTSIATQLQDACEGEKGRTLYPIHLESDELLNEDGATLIGWFEDFVENRLGVDFESCTLYFSGNRSIHVHVPRFVSGEAQREKLKSTAEQFCEETSAELDCAIFSRKRQFRLPGVEHSSTGLAKVPFEPVDGEWNHQRVIRDAQTPYSISSYASVLRTVFGDKPPLLDRATLHDFSPTEVRENLNDNRVTLDLLPSQPDVEPPVIEQDFSEAWNADEKIEWLQYNASEFSPYALADEGGGRSVAVVQARGTPFGNGDRTVGNGRGPIHALVPAYFYAAEGCAGDKFTKTDEHAPLQLSKPDYAKWEFDEGDDVVVIGGRSRRSRLLRISSWEASVAGHALSGEEGSRREVLDYLRSQDYDVGAAGTAVPKTESRTSSHKETGRIFPAREYPQSEAERLQRQAEQGDITELSYPECVQVASRHLRQGWDPTWEWFADQFGASFNPEQTWENLSSIAEEYDEYSEIEIPPRP